MSNEEVKVENEGKETDESVSKEENNNKSESSNSTSTTVEKEGVKKDSGTSTPTKDKSKSAKKPKEEGKKKSKEKGERTSTTPKDDKKKKEKVSGRESTPSSIKKSDVDKKESSKKSRESTSSTKSPARKSSFSPSSSTKPNNTRDRSQTVDTGSPASPTNRPTAKTLDDVPSRPTGGASSSDLKSKYSTLRGSKTKPDPEGALATPTTASPAKGTLSPTLTKTNVPQTVERESQSLIIPRSGRASSSPQKPVDNSLSPTSPIKSLLREKRELREKEAREKEAREKEAAAAAGSSLSSPRENKTDEKARKKAQKEVKDSEEHFTKSLLHLDELLTKIVTVLKEDETLNDIEIQKLERLRILLQNLSEQSKNLSNRAKDRKGLHEVVLSFSDFIKSFNSNIKFLRDLRAQNSAIKSILDSATSTEGGENNNENKEETKGEETWEKELKGIIEHVDKVEKGLRKVFKATGKEHEEYKELNENLVALKQVKSVVGLFVKNHESNAGHDNDVLYEILFARK
eukprot:TRINITY_DN6638_c0_g1_i1.p1 TRINITY_DN6638_c0_g1~~TRINITY_DN6638_c0_g1_i1.p1  ORF type:complete len:517 (+),score=178.28 TRINITY_DN6638_c0_g1_i1:117-1667(+)